MSDLKQQNLPEPPTVRIGWPWTVESSQLAEGMPDRSSWPKISIVTPSYNQGQFIEETIRSVLLQGYPNPDYIIIEGVRELKHLGAGLAPWNFGNYDYENQDVAVYVNSFELLFYHFHGLRRQSPLFLDPRLAGYDSNSIKIQFLKNALYKPYIRELLSIKEHLANTNYSAVIQDFSTRYQPPGLLNQEHSLNTINHLFVRLKVGFVHVVRGYWWFAINDHIF